MQLYKEVIVKRTVGIILVILFATMTVYAAFFPVEIGWDIDDMDKKHVQYEFDSVDSSGGPVFEIKYPLAGGDMPAYFVLMSPSYEVTGMVAGTGTVSEPTGNGIAMKESFDKYYNALIADYGLPLMKVSGNPADEDDVIIYRQGDEDIFEINPEVVVDLYWLGNEEGDFLSEKYSESDQYMCAWMVDSNLLYIVAEARSANEWWIRVFWNV